MKRQLMNDFARGGGLMIALLVSSVVLWAQTAAPTKLGTATVSGRITLGEKPASGVIVGLTRAEIASASEMT